MTSSPSLFLQHGSGSWLRDGSSFRKKESKFKKNLILDFPQSSLSFQIIHLLLIVKKQLEIKRNENS
jgi:hypothetical protein